MLSTLSRQPRYRSKTLSLPPISVPPCSIIICKTKDPEIHGRIYKIKWNLYDISQVQCCHHNPWIHPCQECNHVEHSGNKDTKLNNATSMHHNEADLETESNLAKAIGLRGRRSRVPMMLRPVCIQTGTRSRQALIGVDETRVLRDDTPSREARPLQKMKEPEPNQKILKSGSLSNPSMEETDCYIDGRDPKKYLKNHDNNRSSCQREKEVSSVRDFLPENCNKVNLNVEGEKIASFEEPNKSEQNREPEKFADIQPILNSVADEKFFTIE